MSKASRLTKAERDRHLAVQADLREARRNAWAVGALAALWAPLCLGWGLEYWLAGEALLGLVAVVCAVGSSHMAISAIGDALWAGRILRLGDYILEEEDES